MNVFYCTFSMIVILFIGNVAYGNTQTVDKMVQSMLENEEQIYYDTATGERVSRAKYYGNTLCDQIKRLSPYVYSVSIGIGIFLLVLIRNSGKVKKIAISGFIVGIPLIWYSVAYFMISFIVDRFIN